MREFADRLELPGPEKLVDFFRKLVNGIVGHLKLPPSKRVSADQALYILTVANRIGSDFELAVIPNCKSAGKAQRKNGSIVTLGIKVSDYKGPPDSAGKPIQIDQLPPFVGRKQMVVKEMMIGPSPVWLNTSKLVKAVAFGARSFFVLDLETVAKTKNAESKIDSLKVIEEETLLPNTEPTISSPEAEAAETAPHPEDSPVELEASLADPLPSPIR